MVATLDDVLARLPSHRKSGGGFIARCPAHDDRHASLSVAAGGTVPVVLSCKAGCDFESVSSALGFAKGELTRDSDSDSKSKASRPRRHVATYTYRNQDGSVFARKDRWLDDEGRKTFVWSRPNPIVEGDWLTGTDGYIPLYRLPELCGAPQETTVIVVEGEKDCDRLASLGFVTTTTPNGAASKWRTDDSRFFAARRVCIIADDDDPGRKMAERFVSALKPVALSVGFVTMPNPNGIKGFDTSDFLESGGSIAELTAIVEGFDKPKIPAEVVSSSDLKERVLQLWEEGDHPGVFPGWDVLRELYRPRAGELTIITGAPGAGKSNFLDDMMVRISLGDQSFQGEMRAGWKWLIYSPENFPPQRHAAALLRKFIGKPFNRGPNPRMSEAEIHHFWHLIEKHFTILDPSFNGCNLDRILEVARIVNQAKGIDGLVIDPYNVVAATSRTRGQSEHDFVNEALQKIKLFAHSENVHVMMVAHPTKLKRESSDDEYPVPRPWDISGSASFFNHPDAIISLWRSLLNEDRINSGEVEIHSQKIRFQPECGTLGMALLYFDRITTRFMEQPHEGFARRVTDGSKTQKRGERILGRDRW